MKQCFLFLVALVFIVNGHAQSPVKKITLKLEQYEGTNAASVAYNPDKQLYYTAFAGNSSYYIEVHNLSGKSIFSKAIGADIRGLWYNESTKQLQGILYGNIGSFSFDLNAQGFPMEIQTTDISYGMDDQSVPAYNNGKLYFANENGISVFKVGSGVMVSSFYPKCLNGVSNINFNSLVFNGKKFGIGNSESNSYIVFNSKGKKKAQVQFKASDGASVLSYFNASFANNLVFLFNQETREWIGYQVF